MGEQQTKQEFFECMYLVTYLGLREFVKKRSLDYALTEDILQESYLEVYRHLDDLQMHENCIGWLYKTADYKIRKLNNIYNRHVKFEISWEEWEEEVIDNTCDWFYFEEYRDMLDEKEYELLVRKYRDGYSHKELAQMTHSSVAGSKMKLSRILKKIRKNI